MPFAAWSSLVARSLGLTTARYARPQSTSSAGRQFRPAVEMLEDRLTPAPLGVQLLQGTTLLANPPAWTVNIAYPTNLTFSGTGGGGVPYTFTSSGVAETLTTQNITNPSS